MTRVRMGLGVILLAFLAACGSGGKGNAFTPTTEFVEKLKREGEQLAKSELARFNQIEQASRNTLRYEKSDNPMTPLGAVYFKMYRDYTASRLEGIRRSDSFLHPITVDIAFDYRLMATPQRHTDFKDSPQKSRQDQEFEFVREDSATVSYNLDAFGKLVGALPDLLPRDGILHPAWNKRLAPGQPAVSPLEEPPALPPGS